MDVAEKEEMYAQTKSRKKGGHEKNLFWRDYSIPPFELNTYIFLSNLSPEITICHFEEASPSHDRLYVVNRARVVATINTHVLHEDLYLHEQRYTKTK